MNVDEVVFTALAVIVGWIVLSVVIGVIISAIARR